MRLSRKNQSGFIMLLLVVILALGAATYFGSVARNIAWENKNSKLLGNLDEVNQIKQQLLLYAANFTELYSNNNTSPYNLVSQNLQASPGYLPCPFDLTANTMAGQCEDYVLPTGIVDHEATPGYVQGFLPPGIASRLFYFAGNTTPNSNGKNYILLVDERFVYRNANFNTTGTIQTFRYAPLNNVLAIPPVLQLNDDGKNYVALIIDAGDPINYVSQDQSTLRPASNTPGASLNGYLDRRFADVAQTVPVNDNQDGDRRFYSASRRNYGVNDVVVGITYQEWQQAVKARICGQKDTLLATTDVGGFWFDAYNSATNPAGGDWRTQVNGGFCD